MWYNFAIYRTSSLFFFQETYITGGAPSCQAGLWKTMLDIARTCYKYMNNIYTYIYIYMTYIYICMGSMLNIYIYTVYMGSMLNIYIYIYTVYMGSMLNIDR